MQENISLPQANQEKTREIVGALHAASFML
jgi:hypothetical protein